MESEALPLKLAAILYADVAEYSRLTGEDEQGTHRRLSEYLDLISADIGRYNGRVVHYAGDAVLADFGTVADALICAAATQRELSLRNKDIPEEQKVRFRIGVNLGDVIEDRGDIYGDGVNVAARLEGLAEPGGICISESVHTAVGNKLPFDYEFMGEQEVKNIAKPVKAYRARLQSDVELPAPSKAQKRSKQTPTYIAVAAAVVLAVGAGTLGWLKPWEPREEPASMDRMAFPLPDRPSIAVLPFTNMSDDPKQEYFADGMTEDLITDLSKLSGLFVISRNSTFTYKGKAVKVRQVAEELGVRYVLEGSVRLADSRIRVNVQLIDATTGGHVWAERYDSSLNDIFGVQDKVTQNVVDALAVRLTAEERGAKGQVETDSAEAYQAYLRGQQQLELGTPDGFAEAITNFEEALELDPNYPRVYGALAEVYWHIFSDGKSTELGMSNEESFSKMEHYLAEAMKNPTAQAQHIRSRYLTKQQRFEEAVEAAEQIVTLHPSDDAGYKALGRAANKAGNPARGLDAMTKVRRLNPRGDDAGSYAYRIGESLFLLGRYEEAEAEFLKYQKRSGDKYYSSLLLAGIYGQLGRSEEAKAALDNFNAARKEKGKSSYTLASFDGWNFVPSVRERYVESLRKAGLPPGD